MKKSNRIERKGATRARQAQEKRPAKASVPPKAFPCHRLAPRSPAELRELIHYTANLGEHVVSRVLSGGDVQHLYAHNDDLLMVQESVLFAERGGRRSLSESLWDCRRSLASFLKHRPRLRFIRHLSFEVMRDADVMTWAERMEVGARFSPELRRRLWGQEEAEGTTKGRLILRTVNRSDGGDRRTIYDRCGVFTLEIEETGETKAMEREDVLSDLYQMIARPLLEERIPAVFRSEFRVEFCDREEHAAEAKDVRV
ncbi:MAG: hypothetical protein ABJF10_02045 [Chthoniobacter sp.]|uniref:hypothetical protein n=1 Tax=Chthoniobacter sp. TaxID=2510640 RepID=UPI0032A15F85